MRKIKVSFYDWCLENNLMYMIDLWDYDLNKITPKEISVSTASKYYFKCERGIHESELTQICNITGEKNYRIHCRKCNSFGQWCLDNDKNDLLERWDYELNRIDPFDVSHRSGKKYYFKCPLNNPNHKSSLKIIANVVRQDGSQKCDGCESFGQWCVDNIDENFVEKYWSDKNEKTPFEYSYRSELKVWIKCQNKIYHEDYQISCTNFVSGNRCQYCIGHKVNYYDSLGYINSKSLLLWSDKNDKTAYEYSPYSNKKIYIHCDKHGEQLTKISDYTKRNCECTKCLQEQKSSALQTKVNEYISDVLQLNVLHEQYCNISPVNPKTGYRLKYDNELPDLKLIIEVNGQQHYDITSFTKDSAKEKDITPEEVLEYQKWKDEFKKAYALEQGYEYLSIPYYADDKNETYKQMINEKLNH